MWPVEKTFLLGIDAGTSVIKSVIFDLEGNERWIASARTEVLSPVVGWAEQDMLAVWQAVEQVVARVMAESQLPPHQIAAVGITGQGDGTWLIGRDGEPAYHAIIWLDGRGGELAERWLSEGLSQRLFALTGTLPNTSNQSVQLCWLAQHRPDILDRSQVAVHAKDWVFYKMTGQLCSDESDVSFTFFDVRRRAYSDEVFELLGLQAWRHLMPIVRPCHQNLAPIRREVAERMGLAPDTPVASGPLDVTATALGVGALDAGDTVSILGTAGIHEMVLDRPDTDPPNVGYTMCYPLTDRWLRMVPTMTGTVSLDWFIQQFCQEDANLARQRGVDLYHVLEEAMSQIPPGSGGIIYHPYICPGGERGPFMKPSARAQFFGLSNAHTRHHLLRAVYEGVALSVRDCYLHMPANPTAVRLAGGGARSPFWVQMLADVTGTPMQLFAGSEFGARGAAINAAVAVGLFADYREAVRRMVCPASEFHPHPQRAAYYADIHRLFQQVYRAVWDAWDELARLQRTAEQSGRCD